MRGGVRDGLHRGALLSRRQAGDRLPRAPRMAGAARAAHHRRVPGGGLPRWPSRLGMLPHTNAGILRARRDGAAAQRSNASLGLMLESTSPRLRERGGAHYWAPDKDPAVRLRMHEEAGELGIPFTSGLLLGIGETQRRARRHAARDPRARRSPRSHPGGASSSRSIPKPGTRMRDVPALGDAEVAAWVAMARLVLGPAMNVQAPPNLAPEALELLLRSGLNDWGGVSPLTVDFINPEAPWPTLARAARAAPRRPGSAWSSGFRSTPSTCSAGRSSSMRACARLRSVSSIPPVGFPPGARIPRWRQHDARSPVRRRDARAGSHPRRHARGTRARRSRMPSGCCKRKARICSR